MIVRWTAAALLAIVIAGEVAAGQDQRAPQFRSGIVLVPVDVRVVDPDGNPITDLTVADFTVIDRGVTQQVAHFATRSWMTTASLPRTFAIALGRGRLSEPTKGLDAAVEFVRTLLLPEDRVVVVAYQRATEPTTDRAAAVRLLERYGAVHDRIEALIDRDGSRALGAPEWPLTDETRSALDKLFDAPGLPASQLLPGGAGARGPIPFSDFRMLVTAIDYLRHLEGEKHLVFLSEDVFLADGGELARKAAAARVSVSLVQTGGLRQQTPVPSAQYAGRVDPYAIGPSLDQARLVAAANAFAEQTGGWASLYRAADKPFTRLARATSFEYLLGYYPTDPPAEGEYRDIEVRVRRAGARLFYRHGYETRPRLDEPLDPRRLLAEDRILALASRPAMRTSAWDVSPPTSWTRASATVIATHGDSATVQVDITLDPGRVTFAVMGEQYACDLDMGVFVTDARGTRIGQRLERVALKLDAREYARAKRDRIPLHVTLAAVGRPTQVKVVVFEYDSNRASVATAAVR